MGYKLIEKRQNQTPQASVCVDGLCTVFMSKIYEWLLPNLLPAVFHEINFVDILNYNQNHVSLNYRSNIPSPLPA